MRVLALAESTIPLEAVPAYESLNFLGLVGFRDPPRIDVKEAIADCRHAGIRVVMVTGDHASTARAIAEMLGLAAPGTTILVEGRELEALAALGERERARVLAAQVFARVTPAQKLELVRLYQSAGEVVAMTGDGVNDAPALQKADIGVAMGLRGTEVAREAADIVLRDDAFGSIVAAIREGRVIFSNLRRFLIYLLSCNISEVMVVALAVVAGLPLPLLPLQILFLNLVTDVLPAFALATGEGEDDVLRQPPRNPREPLLGQAQWWFIAVYGALLTISTLASLLIGRYWLELHGDALVSVSFLTLAFAQLFHVFNMRGRSSGLLLNAVTRNAYVWVAVALCSALLLLALYAPPLASALRLEAPDLEGWILVIVASGAPLLLGMIIGASSHLLRRGQGQREPVIGDVRLDAMRLAEIGDAGSDLARIALDDAAPAMGEDRTGDPLLRTPTKLGNDGSMSDQGMIAPAHHRARDRGAVADIKRHAIKRRVGLADGGEIGDIEKGWPSFVDSITHGGRSKRMLDGERLEAHSADLEGNARLDDAGVLDGKARNAVQGLLGRVDRA